MRCARFNWVTIELSYVTSINFVHESISHQTSIHPTRPIKTTNLSSKPTPMDQIWLRTEVNRVKMNTQKLMTPLRVHKNCLLWKHLQQLSHLTLLRVRAGDLSEPDNHLKGLRKNSIDLFLSYVLISFLLCNCVFRTKGGGIVMYCIVYEVLLCVTVLRMSVTHTSSWVVRI